MQTQSAQYHYRLTAWGIVLMLSIVASIAMQEWWIMLIPFCLVLVPKLLHFILTNSEQLWWLLLITIPLSTELNITPQLGIDFPDELLLILLSALIIAKIIAQPAWFPRELLIDPLFFIVFCSFVWTLITCITAAEPLLACKFLLAKAWYLLPFLLLPQKLLVYKSQWKKLALCLLAPMCVVVLLTLVRHAFYGFSFAGIKYMLKPFFRNHVNYSSMLVCLLPVGWAAWKFTTAPVNKKRIGYLLLIALAALLFAYSRGAWVALLMGIAAIWVIRKKWMGQFIALAIVLITAIGSWLLTDARYLNYAPDHDRTVFHPALSEHLAATVKMKDISTAERFYRWIAAINMVNEHPVTGYGPNSFYPHYRSFTVRSFETWVSDNPEHSTVHNYLLLLAAEQGLVGLLLFCVLYIAMLLRAQRLYHQLNDQFYKTIALVIGAVLIMVAVINMLSDMIETDKIGSLFWLALGGLIVLHTHAKKMQSG